METNYQLEESRRRQQGAFSTMCDSPGMSGDTALATIEGIYELHGLLVFIHEGISDSPDTAPFLLKKTRGTVG